MSIKWPFIKSVVLIIVILLYWFMGYYPLHRPPGFNNGAFLSKEDGLQFPTAGIATTTRAPAWLTESLNSLSFEISLDVQTKSVEQTGPAYILTISENNIITVGQEGVDLIVLLRSHDEIFGGTKEFVVRKVFDDLDRHNILLSLRPGELAVTVDGTKQLTAVLPIYSHNTQMYTYILALGNKVTYDQPWLGIIREAVFHTQGRQMDFLKPGVLELSGTYYLQFVLHRINPLPFFKEDYTKTQFQDWAVNFFGFIPLGLLCVVLYPSWRSIWRIAIISFGVSFVIEATQIFLPWRTPGLSDLLLNTLGGATGAWIGMKYWRDSKIQSEFK